MFKLQCFGNVLLLISIFLVMNSLFAIKTNCGTDAVIGEPYDITCTELPDYPVNGIRVFRDDKSLRIIQCFGDDKSCISTNTKKYTVISPHTLELKFTIVNITEDDINKKYYCLDSDNKPSTPPTEHCTLKVSLDTITAENTKQTDTSTETIVRTVCDGDVAIGEAFNISCTGITDELKQTRMKVYREGDINSIISCTPSGSCSATIDATKYKTYSIEEGKLIFKIRNVSVSDIDKKYVCTNRSQPPERFPSETSCFLVPLDTTTTKNTEQSDSSTETLVRTVCDGDLRIGEAFNISCTGITDELKQTFMRVYREGDVNSIILCTPNGTCSATDDLTKYTAYKIEEEKLIFTINIVSKGDLNKSYICTNSKQPPKDFLPEKSCSDSDEPLAPWKIAVIVVVCLGGVAVVIVIFIKIKIIGYRI